MTTQLVSTLPTQFGDGSDGALHITADAEMSAAELNLTSLEIDATKTWSAQKMSVSQRPLVIIRCLTPIILNGTISLDEIGGALDGDDSGLIIDQRHGDYAAVFRVGSISAANDHEASAMAVYPIASGGGDTSIQMGSTRPLAGYTSSVVNSGADGDSIFAGNRDDLIGPGRLFEICVGCGGSQNGCGDPIGKGGGAIRIYAPAIIFGSSGAISACGGDGADQADADGAGGGGGGGYVETWTKTPITDADWAKVTVAGGTGGTNTSNGLDGGDGMDGHKVRRIIR